MLQHMRLPLAKLLELFRLLLGLLSVELPIDLIAEFRFDSSYLPVVVLLLLFNVWWMRRLYPGQVQTNG